ncbi:HEAT repeat-containing protein 1 [Rhizopus stolonifer]|uniref:U3 small nucleolar RNA-associated protein 10 n=1 Tax=Rhizopus stolonifer TaxID=4846 RepID=A0A367KXW7_RHIST|nr:HEAT repeat-containing protein 1 [Rhizopus stolonifer]
MSLKQQLKKIGTLDLRNVSESSRKTRPSFLFTPREAADQDLETIYSIAYNGIMELVILDDKFASFEKTLFSERMKSVDRVLQTKEENDKLNSSINAFLCQLSPYFLLKPSGKVLEYLIRRFRIQDFNIESILKCILPYHETKSFVKMISIMTIPEKSPWEFLLPIKKSLLPLERSSLVKKIAKQRYVFNFLCKMVTKAMVPFPTLYSFYAALMTDFIKHLQIVSNDVVIALTPHLIDGLQAKHLPELQIANYMILSQLSSKAAFSAEGSRAIVEAMIKNFKKSYYDHCLLTVVHLCQTQEALTSVSPKAAKHFIKSSKFESSILQVADKYATENFFKIFLPTICDHAKNIETLDNLVLKGYLSSENVKFLCNTIIDNYLSISAESKKEKSEYIERFQSLLAMISQRFIEELDTVLDAKLTNSKDDASLSANLYEFASAAFKGTRHEIIPETNTTLYLCLNSPSTTNRILAIKKLIAIISEASNPLAQTPEMFQDALAGCLDSFGPLLNFVIEEAPNHLLERVSAEKMLASFNKLFNERNSMDSKDTMSIVKFLLTHFISQHPEQDKQVARILARFVFTASAKYLTSLLKCVKEPHLDKSPITDAMFKNFKSSAESDDMFDVPVKFIKLQADLIKQNKDKQFIGFWTEMVKSKSKADKTIALLVLGLAITVLSGQQEYSIYSTVLESVSALVVKENKTLFYSTVLTKELHDEKSGLPSKEFIKKLKNTENVTDATVMQLDQFTMKNMTNNLDRPHKDINWAIDTSNYTQLVLKLFVVFVSGPTVAGFESFVTLLIEKQLDNDALRFMTSVWSNSDNSAIVRARALQITASYLYFYVDNNNKMDFQHLVPALFPNLADTNVYVRTQALRCLEHIRNIYFSQGYPFGAKVYDTTLPDDKTMPPHVVANKVSILPPDTFYNQNANVAGITSNEAAHLVDFLWYRNDEISKDPSYISRVFKDYLSLCEASNKSHKSRKTHTLTFLIRHVTQAPTVQLQVDMLHMLDSVDSPLKLQLLYPLLEETLNKPRTSKSSALVSSLIRTFLPCNAPDLGSKGDKTLSLFVRLLANKDSLQGEDEDGWQVSTRRYALDQITPEFFENLNTEARELLFTTLINIATHGVQNDVRASKTVLSSIEISAKMFDDVLLAGARTLLGTSAASAPVSKRARGKPAKSVASVDLYELVTLLELIESKTIAQDETLVKSLFEVLTAMVNADLRDSPVSLEYVNQLVMSALTRIIHNAEEKGVNVEESALRVDVVVQCIRITGNPQTHNQALLLMANIASMYPECVLHNIMPLFTFMGANVLRQDDNYSFQVIQQTMEKILPPLVVSSRKSNNDDENALVLEVRPIIKVFVDALFHIPKHRRLRLFTILIHTLGEEEFLFAIISLLMEKFTERLSKGARADAESLTEFSLVICQHFGPKTQMKAILSLFNGLLTLPNEKPEDVEMTDNSHLFNLVEHNSKQLRQYKLATLSFIGQLLSSKTFLNKIMIQNNASEEFAESMQPYYLESVTSVLKIVAYFTEYRDVYSVSERANPSVSKFWRSILKVVYDVLDKVNALLSLDVFINVIKDLCNHNDHSIRRKAMNIFNEKINSFEGHAPEGYEELLVAMIQTFTDIIKNESKSPISEDDRATNKQSALLCIASLAKILGNIYPGQFSDAIPVVIGPDSLQSSNTQLQTTSLVCLTVICQEIGPRSVPHLPKFMPAAINILDLTVNAENPNNLLQLSVISALETIVQVLPHFISPYITKLLAGLLNPTLYAFDSAQTQKVAIEAKSKNVLTLIATHVPPRMLLNPLFSYFEIAVQNGKDSILALCSMVSQAIRTMSRDVMTSHYKQLFKFFLLAFDIRRTTVAFSSSQVDEVESSVISAFLDLVMKLNETLFKPLYLKIVDWATNELAADEAAESDDQHKRVVFFYKLTDALLDKLKTIFTPYYGYLIDDVIMRLEGYKNEEQEVDELWNYVISTLHKSFLYDNDNLWNAAKFEKIMDPVVDQMLVATKGTSTDYLVRMNTYLVPCIGQMAVTVSNDTLWKPLNHKVLLQTRQDNPDIRLAALYCIQEFYVRLGEEWLLFLAESISFLAELMEDDDVRVEKLVQRTNSLIETHLGESLDKFFN